MSDNDSFIPWTTPHERGRLIVRMAAALLALVAIAFGVSWTFANGPYVSDRPFDAEKWASADPFSDDTRWRMRDDLREHHLHLGMPLSEV